MKKLVTKVNSFSGILNRDLKLTFISNFIGAFGEGLFVYILPIYIRSREATSAAVGLLFSLLNLSTALTIIPGGFLADKFDRKKIIILCWLILIPLPLMFSAATYWSQFILPMILFGLFFSGPATNAYVANSAKTEYFTLTFALFSASWSSGYIFSSAIGGYVAQIYGVQLVFLLAFILFAIATSLLLPISSQNVSKLNISTENFNNSIRAKKIVLFSLFFGIVMFSQMMVRPLIPQFLEEIGFDIFSIGVFGSLTSLGWALFAFVFGTIGDKWAKMRAVSASLLIGSLSFGLLVSFNNFYFLALALFLNGATYPIWYLMNASISAIAPKGYRGRWISLSQVIAMSAAFVAPYLGGVLYENSPYAPFHLIILVTLLLAAVALTKPFRKSE